MVDDALTDLRERLRIVHDLRAAAAVLHWDQATHMPAGGAAARGQQLATLQRLAHERLTDPVVGERLAQLADAPAAAPLVRVAQREYDRAVQAPAALVAELATHTAALYEQWTRARPANDFAAVRPGLERTLELSRQLSACFPAAAHVADPLIDEADPGLTVATLRPLFAALRAELRPLVEQIAAHPVADDACLRQRFPIAAQERFGAEAIRAFGYDFARGRQDCSPHPFMTSFSIGDVRITTRFRADDLGDGLFSTLHEAGHALYEQGIDPALEGTLLAGGASAGLHESQSRLWENIVGRSRGFWEHFYPRLQTAFPAQLGGVPGPTFYRAINKVERSLIRTDADEVTYNLHVLIRFELELELLEGRLAVRDLPAAWRERYRTELGVTPPDDRDGVLQDVHWFGGVIGGAFQCYTIGNILSAQIFEAATRACPAIPAAITRGEFAELRDWLREQIYRPGRSWTTTELIDRVTGQPLTTAPYLRYLREKFGELHNL